MDHSRVNYVFELYESTIFNKFKVQNLSPIDAIKIVWEVVEGPPVRPTLHNPACMQLILNLESYGILIK